jgi:hypothetical protein
VRILDLFIICALALFWNGIVPVAGAFWGRRAWRLFRRRYDELRLRPFLDYAARWEGEGKEFRFIGSFESLSGKNGAGGGFLWIKNDNLTVPVALDGALTYVLPEHDENPAAYEPGRETPQRIKWEQLASLSGGARVYVGGQLLRVEGRPAFVSSRERPLLVILYDGPDRSLTARAIRAGRRRNEYWNTLTPYALALGAFSQFIVLLNYIRRPVFQPTVAAAIAALCLPVLPLIPPAFLFTILYRRLWWQARLFRAWRDLALLPLRYLADKEGRTALPGGEPYAGMFLDDDETARRMESGALPRVLPESAVKARPRRWYVFGALKKDAGAGEFVAAPDDPQATWGTLPGDPEKLARRFTVRAYALEIASWLLLLCGIALNLFFAGLILSAFRR